MVLRWTPALEALTGRLRRRLLILGPRLIAAVSSAGGQSQVEGLEKQRPGEQTSREKVGRPVGWLKGRLDGSCRGL
jgi:hypothetical protein